MTCSQALGIAFLVVAAGCDARVGESSALDRGGNVDPATTTTAQAPTNSVVLDANGTTVARNCPNSAFQMGGGCGTASGGVGPAFNSFCSDSTREQELPRYSFVVLFRDFRPYADTSDGMTLDLSDTSSRDYVTVMLEYQDPINTFNFCTAPAADAPPGTLPVVSGTIILHHVAPTFGELTTEAELTNVVVPSVDGGAPFKIVSAKLYF